MEEGGPAAAPEMLAIVPVRDFTALAVGLVEEREAWSKLDPESDTATDQAVKALEVLQAEVRAGNAQALREALVAAGGDDLADALSALIVLEDA